MRNILKNTSEVMHYWANKVQPSGKSGSVFFRDSMIFSYGNHFCMARILPIGDVVVFTTRKYSITTSGHISGARMAASHLKKVYCHDPMDSASSNYDHTSRAITQLLADAMAPKIRQTTRDKCKANAFDLATEFNEYLAALPASERAKVKPFDTDALEFDRSALVTAEVAKRQATAKHEAKRIADAKLSEIEKLAKWRTGEHVYAFYCVATALRLSIDGAIIETSRGANIPTSFAPRLWRLIHATMASGIEWNSPPEHTQPVGVYSLSRVRTDGSIVVGCHDIPYTEIEGIAKALGLLSEALPA